MYNISDEYLEEGRERPNKSQLKREAQALLDLAKLLAELQPTQWPDLLLPEFAIDELLALSQMHQFGARKRQIKRIAKVLRDVDVTVAMELIARLDAKSNEVSVAFHQVERWRDRLLEGEGDVLTDFINQHSDVDVQSLRRLVQGAKLEKAQGKSPKSARLLFKMIKASVG